MICYEFTLTSAIYWIAGLFIGGLIGIPLAQALHWFLDLDCWKG